MSIIVGLHWKLLLLTDPLLSGYPYLWPPSQNPVFDVFSQLLYHAGLAGGQIAPLLNCSFSFYPFELKLSGILNFNVFRRENDVTRLTSIIKL